ncbi:hypothetical protein CXF83_15760 [Shewanella sp. Choline-02u-19]|uniref:hypothetical protein n=1 Tax=unclassified Shewanella TaxID=196818 RepID=UPI000C337E87|nr:MULTISPECIES: hypothetical protein [unclassified Shewanella]PKH60974.1 hypothetical protein CXF84_01815 [Shewanella sp. Bg11-22]PKI28067.1 hypothetical protein CXF83_15760 [Shewanella sp. Choline-02u-19]
MTFIRSIVQQWNKSKLGYSLLLALQTSGPILQLFVGATKQSTVTNLIAALVYSDGEPIWLSEHKHDSDTPLSDKLVLNCLFSSSHILFVKVAQGHELNQAERLILTIAKVWVAHKGGALVNENIGELINTINTQVETMKVERRIKLKNMQ